MPKAANPVDVHVGLRVRARRLAVNMSQQRLAGSLGITFQQIQKYEKGTNRIGAGRLLHIAQILEVTPSYFFESAGQNSRGPTNAPRDFALELLSDPIARDLAKAFVKVQVPSLRKQIVRLVEAMTRDE